MLREPQVDAPVERRLLKPGAGGVSVHVRCLRLRAGATRKLSEQSAVALAVRGYLH